MTAAAVLALAFAGVSLVGGWVYRQDAWRERSRRAAVREVALNHRKNLDLEFRGASLAALRGRMHRLEFPVAGLPPQVTPRDSRLLGARYCSIQGKLAMQLRLRSADGKRITVFIARPAPELKSLTRHEEKIDGVKVNLWSHNGLIFAAARAADSSQQP